MLVVITSPTATPEEIRQYAGLFEAGLQCLHLRLPGRSVDEYEEALLAIPPRYRYRVVLCDHFELAEKFGVGGIHLRKDNRHEYPNWVGLGLRISTSAHSIEELEGLHFSPTYALLSPVYDSISKEGYKSGIDVEECRAQLPLLPFPVLALGGVTPDRMQEVSDCGFGGAAVLGYISGAGRYMTEAFQRFPLPEVLSVAGHDPSSGAGLVADALTIQQAGGFPLTVASSLTIQDADTFDEIIPLSEDDVLEPLSFLLDSGHVPLAAKIGLVSDMYEALVLARSLASANVRYIIWDPILAPTAKMRGEQLFVTDKNLLEEILSYVTLVTPNKPEAEQLFGTTDIEYLQRISMDYDVAILLKGGHTESILSADVLITPDDERFYAVPRTPYDKHGTGCMLSAHIATRLAQGFSLEQACRMGQCRVDEYRRSAIGRVGQWNFSTEGMKRDRLKNCTLQFITDSPDEQEILRTCKQVLDGGVRWIQLRMKEATHEKRVSVAKALKALMQGYIGSTLIIDDDIAAVLEVDADGVHVGLQDMSPVDARYLLGEGKIIGGTCNTPEHIRQRALEGVDYVGVGPYRHTTTKANLSAILGVEGMQRMIEVNHRLPHPIPMVGIGGIALEDLPKLAALGLDGVALSGVINRAENIEETAKKIQEACDSNFHR